MGSERYRYPVAYNEPPPPIVQHAPPAPPPPPTVRDWQPLTAEVFSPMTEHVVVFEVVVGSGDRWWAWCVVNLGGLGFSRVAWSKPTLSTDTPTGDGPDLNDHRSRTAPRFLFAYDTPLVTDEAKVG